MIIIQQINCSEYISFCNIGSSLDEGDHVSSTSASAAPVAVAAARPCGGSKSACDDRGGGVAG